MKTLQLENRVALVTGAGRGIGRAIALGFSQQGATIVGVARTEPELSSLENDIKASGGKAVMITADLSDPAAPARVIREAKERAGTIDILVNNAGVGSSIGPRPVIEFDDAVWNLTLAINLTAPYLFCKAALPILLEKKYGRIINIASIASKIGTLHGAAYAASKHGLLGLTKTLAMETAGSGITVNAICPGPVRSEMNNKRVQYDATRLGITTDELERRMTPLGRRLEPDEMVPMAILLASEDSEAITGQAFNICGGILMV